MYLRWAIAIIALGLAAKHVSPPALLNILTMRPAIAALEDMAARRR